VRQLRELREFSVLLVKLTRAIRLGETDCIDRG
jgi:hypothetical protein